MPEIIGPHKLVHSNVPPLEAHVGHLLHLTNAKVAGELLVGRFGFIAADARNAAKLFSAQVRQSIEFHNESLHASFRIRPVLQYYSYLNLAVAAILAYRPPNHNQYRQHGVSDKSHALKQLNLASEVVTISRGVVPLFHSIISDASLRNRTFQFRQLIAGIHMVASELTTEFSQTTTRIYVSDRIIDNAGTFSSHIEFTSSIGGQAQAVASKKLEEAMPLLRSSYLRSTASKNPLIYDSRQQWSSETQAVTTHNENCRKLINYGGHTIEQSPVNINCIYTWCGLTRVPLLPTLTSLLLFSFSLASLVRYRPALLDSALSSPIRLLLDTFVQESDAIFIPALRNMLYREEMYIGSAEFI